MPKNHFFAFLKKRDFSCFFNISKNVIFWHKMSKIPLNASVQLSWSVRHHHPQKRVQNPRGAKNASQSPYPQILQSHDGKKSPRFWPPRGVQKVHFLHFFTFFSKNDHFRLTNQGFSKKWFLKWHFGPTRFWSQKNHCFLTTSKVRPGLSRDKKNSLFFQKKNEQKKGSKITIFLCFFVFFSVFFVIFCPFFDIYIRSLRVLIKNTYFVHIPQKWPFFSTFFTFFTFFAIFGRFSALTARKTQKWPLKMTLFWPLFYHFFSTFLLFPE